jgi:hypothetical protein
MAVESAPEITRLLRAWGDGDARALDLVMPLVYEELRQAAHRYIAREASGHTLQTTALVNEVYLRLAGVRRGRWQNRAYANVGLAAPELLPDALVARVLKGAAAAVEFEALIWERVAFGGANPDARHIRSLRWDQRIAFNIGGSMRGRPLWLVTDDRAFTAVAKAVGCEDRVNTLAAYQRWLGISAGV